MNRLKSYVSKLAPRPRKDRGSALIVSLMVLVGLSLLGLAFVTISETESAISVNQRNALQTKAVAEAGAHAVMEWFQSPSWARSIGIMPLNNPAPTGMKRARIINGVDIGVYKPDPASLLFSKPYRPAVGNRFYGDDSSSDILLNDAIDATTMRALNTYLFGADSRVNGRISEIRVYAPPMIGGTLTDGFWNNGERFGTATIKVTAEKWSTATGGKLLSTGVVRLVVGEFPLPVPGGPIQTASNANFGGAFDVHWGLQAALGTLNTAKTGNPIPYANAFERPHFERGHPTDPNNGYDAEVWPVDTSTTYDNAPYLSELLGKGFSDPWAENRARGTVDICPCPTYNYNMGEGSKNLASFQNQTTTLYPTSRAVTFPTINYDTWKRVAIQGRGQKGIYYFTYAGTNLFKRNGQGTAHPVAYWVNTRSGANLGAGFYFFDTMDATNPQLTGGGTNTAVLTDALDWGGARDFNGDFLMKGFIYLNASSFGTQGVGSAAPTLPYNMPGEMYRDIGYRKITGAPGTVGAWLMAGGAFVSEKAGNGQWDYQDVNGNKKFDLVIDGPFNVVANAAYPGQSTPTGVYKPRTWSSTRVPACTVPPVSGAMPATACSEPHEPYLNFIYPTIGSPTGDVTVGWEAPGSETLRPRDLISTAVPNCNVNPEFCTSNGFDANGALVNLPVILEGVLYNEGTYQSQGNVDYFGSVLIKGNTGATGTPAVWFDEKLIKGDWAPAGMPNVIVYSEETSEQ
jgi:hypothetical protein